MLPSLQTTLESSAGLRCCMSSYPPAPSIQSAINHLCQQPLNITTSWWQLHPLISGLKAWCQLWFFPTIKKRICSQVYSTVFSLKVSLEARLSLCLTDITDSQTWQNVTIKIQIVGTTPQLANHNLWSKANKSVRLASFWWVSINGPKKKSMT